MTPQTLISGALASLGIITCGALAALGHPIPDVLVLATSTAIGGYFGAAIPTRPAGRPDAPPGRHADQP